LRAADAILATVAAGYGGRRGGGRIADRQYICVPHDPGWKSPGRNCRPIKQARSESASGCRTPGKLGGISAVEVRVGLRRITTGELAILQVRLSDLPVVVAVGPLSDDDARAALDAGAAEAERMRAAGLIVGAYLSLRGEHRAIAGLAEHRIEGGDELH
jgi:hypothetical protein